MPFLFFISSVILYERIYKNKGISLDINAIL